MGPRCLLSTVCLLLLAAPGAAQEVRATGNRPHTRPSGQTHAEQAQAAQMQELMARWSRYSEPATQHIRLQRLVGDWRLTIKIWMAPDSEPRVNQATAHAEPLLGGRFVIQRVEGDFMGKPFQGIGIDGYDIYKMKYSSLWMDNTSTFTQLLYGTCDADGRSCSYFGQIDDFLADEPDKTVRARVVWRDDDHFTIESFSYLPGGEEFKTMEASYTRVKD